MKRIDPHRLLGVAPDASPEEVRTAFREKVRQRHPDTSSDGGEGLDVQEIVEAYRELSDPDRRRRSGRPESDIVLGGHRVQVRHAKSPRKRDGEGAQRCTTCEGSGELREDELCRDCKGRAEITALEGTRARIVRCRRCSGDGTVVSTRRCDACSGTGHIRV